jgi:hypothetical protein
MSRTKVVTKQRVGSTHCLLELTPPEGTHQEASLFSVNDWAKTWACRERVPDIRYCFTSQVLVLGSSHIYYNYNLKS